MLFFCLFVFCFFTTIQGSSRYWCSDNLFSRLSHHSVFDLLYKYVKTEGEGLRAFITYRCLGHMEKQEMEMKRKLEMETGNRNRKRKTEMEMQLLPCFSPSKIQLLLSQCSPCLQFLLC